MIKQSSKSKEGHTTAGAHTDGLRSCCMQSLSCLESILLCNGNTAGQQARSQKLPYTSLPRMSVVRLRKTRARTSSPTPINLTVDDYLRARMSLPTCPGLTCQKKRKRTNPRPTTPVMSHLKLVLCALLQIVQTPKYCEVLRRTPKDSEVDVYVNVLTCTSYVKMPRNIVVRPRPQARSAH